MLYSMLGVEILLSFSDKISTRSPPEGKTLSEPFINFDNSPLMTSDENPWSPYSE